MDLFFYREPEEAKEPQEEEAPAPDYGDFTSAALGVQDSWGTSNIPEGEWTMAAQPPIPAVPAAGWPAEPG